MWAAGGADAWPPSCRARSFLRSVSVSRRRVRGLEEVGRSPFKPFDLLEESGRAAVTARDALGGAAPDVCLFFTSMADGAKLQELPDVLYRTFGQRVLLLGGEAPPGVVGGFLQGLPAVSLLCLSLGERARARAARRRDRRAAHR